MNVRHSVRALLAAVGFVLTPWLASHGWAQLVSQPAPDAGGRGGTAVALVVLIGVMLLILAVLVKMLDLKRKRESEAVIIQAQISDAVLREPELFSLPITPTAHVPLWKGTPVTVDVAGQVPSEELREAALRVVEREAAHLRPDVRIESRVGVVPTMAHRAMAER